MPDPLSAFVDDRSALLQQISELGDFQPGSITSASRRCGSPSCHCAKPNDPGHGPHFQLTQKIDGKTVTQNLPSPAALRKAESEIAAFREFQALTGELVKVNRKICRLRPVEQTEHTAQEKNRASDPTRSCPRSNPLPADHFSGSSKQPRPTRFGSDGNRHPIGHAPSGSLRPDSTAAI